MIAKLIALLRERPRTLLAVYWTCAFVVTHVPPLLPKDDDRGPELPIGPDKVVHFGGFLTLAFLLAQALRPRLSAAATVACVLGICACYGVFDEITQPPFGRTADAWDWVADMVGACVGLLLFRLARRRGL